MNEVRFSNTFIEKRTSHFLKALSRNTFLLPWYGGLTSKIEKYKSILFCSLALFRHSFSNGDICIYSVGMPHLGAKSALLRRLFMPMAKKTSSARSLAPPFQITTAYAGLRFGFWRRPERRCIYTVEMTHVGASFVALAPAFYNSQSVLTPPLLLSKSQPLTLGCDLVLGSSQEAGASI